MTGELRFNVTRLAIRLVDVTDWLSGRTDTRALALGYFGASTGAAAALVAAAARPQIVRAVVSRGGRPDLAGDALQRVRAATLLIVGANDFQVLALNLGAKDSMRAATTEIAVVPNATHLFEETGALEEVSRLAADWFEQHLVERPVASAAG
jgi:putative phosphoribosyl transferase